MKSDLYDKEHFNYNEIRVSWGSLLKSHEWKLCNPSNVNNGKTVLKTHVITACFLILSIFAQGISAASTPCPMLDASGKHSDMNHADMNHSGMDHSNMDHIHMTHNEPDSLTQGSPAQQNLCCNDESCPMNLMVMGFTLSQPSVNQMRTEFKVHTPDIINLYLSLTPSGLYRPPANA